MALEDKHGYAHVSAKECQNNSIKCELEEALYVALEGGAPKISL